jgi:small subunit ribosomal protein S7e
MSETKKIVKPKGVQVTALEKAISKAWVELESTKDFGALKTLRFVAAKEIDVTSGNQCLVIFYPFRQTAAFKGVQQRLIHELEKKFSGKHIVFVAQRTILNLGFKRSAKGALRPRSRTLTDVHAQILKDIVSPTQITGQRTRFRSDGSKLLKVFLDRNDMKDIDYKLPTFAAVYRKLTNKRVEFVFPAADQ